MWTIFRTVNLKIRGSIKRIAHLPVASTMLCWASIWQVVTEFNYFDYQLIVK